MLEIATACPRCGGLVTTEPDGDLSCVVCGWRDLVCFPSIAPEELAKARANRSGRAIRYWHDTRYSRKW